MEYIELKDAVNELYRICGVGGRDEFLIRQPQLQKAKEITACVSKVLDKLDEQDRYTLIGIVCEAEQACMKRGYVTSNDWDIFASKEEWDEGGSDSTEEENGAVNPAEMLVFDPYTAPDYRSAEIYFTFLAKHLKYTPYGFIRDHDVLIDGILAASRYIFVRRIVKAAKTYIKGLPGFLYRRELRWVLSLEEKAPMLISDILILVGTLAFSGGAISTAFTGNAVIKAVLAALAGLGIFYFLREHRKSGYDFQRIIYKITVACFSATALALLIGIIIGLF